MCAHTHTQTNSKVSLGILKAPKELERWGSNRLNSLGAAHLCCGHIVQEDFNEADHAAREEARGGEEQRRCHAADGDHNLNLREWKTHP